MANNIERMIADTFMEMAQGLETALQIQDLHRQGLKDEEISRHTNVPLDTVRKLLRNEP